MKHYFLSILLMILPVVAWADAVEIDGIWYNLITKGKAAEVTKNPSDQNGGTYSGAVTIPASIEYEGTTYSVTIIGDYAFSNCSGLTSVTIPESVISIRNYAFENCSGLTSVHITDLEAWCKITFGSNPLSYAHHLFLNGQEITDLIIPEGVTSISGGAFYGCTGLTSATIPKGVTSIGDWAFSGCSGLTSVTIPEGVTFISSYTFYGCSSLTSVTIPEGVTSIGEFAFQDCSSLTSVNIPESVTYIYTVAFWGCSGLTSVHITNLEAWCKITFEASNPLSYAHHLFLNGQEITDLIIPEGVTSISNQAFEGCSGLTSVTIPKGVTRIGNSAFYDCSGLTSVTIPESVTSIDNYAFYNCSSLTNVTIPEGVTSIGENTFYGCSGLTSVTIPASVTSIGRDAFHNCSELKDVYCSATRVPTDYTSIFGGSYIEYATLHVPAEAIENYRKSVYWSGFGNIVSLTDGEAIYRMTVTVTGKGSIVYNGATVSGGSQVFYVKGSEGAVLTLTADDGYQIESVLVNGEDMTASVAEGQLTIGELTADLTVSVTFAYAGETATLTVGSEGMATFCYDDALDFSEVAGIRAYVASGFKSSDGRLLLMHVSEVPAGTGLVIKGTPGTYTIPVKPTDFYYLNLLKPAFEAITVPAETDGYANYVLANGADGLLFYRSDNATLAANRAYLQLPATAAAARRHIHWEEAGEATAISSVRGSEKQAVYYNLQGQRVAHPSKGLYIKDGKKVFIK